VLLGTSCELGEPFANPMGTHWEQGKKTNKKTLEFFKNSSSPKVALCAIGTSKG
jgi:hypothetical protein